MKKKFLDKWLIAALLGISVMAGCGSEAEEQKANYRQMGIEYMEKGDYANAITSFEAALAQGVRNVTADDLDISYYKAAALYANGDLEAAKTTYNAIIDFDEEAFEAYYLRGCLYCKQGDLESAKADFAKAAKYNPNDYKLYLNIYENLMSIGAKEEGLAYLDQALKIEGSEMVDLEYRGQIHYLIGEYDKAILELREAVEAGSTYANLYLAKCYEDAGEDALAEECFKSYTAAVPKDAVALNELGEMMLEKEQYAQAALYFEKGLVCDVVPNSRALMHNLIIAYEFSGEFDKAWDLVQEYVTLFPEDADAQREYVFLKNRQMKEETEEPVEDTQGTEETESTENSEGTRESEDLQNADGSVEDGNEQDADASKNEGSRQNTDDSKNEDNKQNTDSSKNEEDEQSNSRGF